jgi:hypothetical protein
LRLLLALETHARLLNGSSNRDLVSDDRIRDDQTKEQIRFTADYLNRMLAPYIQESEKSESESSLEQICCLASDIGVRLSCLGAQYHFDFSGEGNPTLRKLTDRWGKALAKKQVVRHGGRGF